MIPTRTSWGCTENSGRRNRRFVVSDIQNVETLGVSYIPSRPFRSPSHSSLKSCSCSCLESPVWVLRNTQDWIPDFDLLVPVPITTHLYLVPIRLNRRARHLTSMPDQYRLVWDQSSFHTSVSSTYFTSPTTPYSVYCRTPDNSLTQKIRNFLSKIRPELCPKSSRYIGDFVLHLLIHRHTRTLEDSSLIVSQGRSKRD